MKYVVRALKYFVEIVVLLALILGILILLKFVEPDISKMFRSGWESVWMLLAMFALLSAIYPAVGYMKKIAAAGGSLPERREEIIRCMEGKGYVLKSEKDGVLKFRQKSILKRITRVFEGVTLKGVLGGFELEGYRKDVVPLSLALEMELAPKKSEDVDEQ